MSFDSREACGTAAVIPGAAAINRGQLTSGAAQFQIAETIEVDASSKRTWQLMAAASPAHTAGSFEGALGARFAAEIALESMRTWLASAHAFDPTGAELAAQRAALISNWRERVARCDEQTALKAHGVSAPYAYDARVAVVAVSERSVVYVTVGAAKLVLLDASGTIVSTCVDTTTSSESLASACGDRLTPAAVGCMELAQDGYLTLLTVSRTVKLAAVALPGAGHLRDHGKVCQDAALAFAQGDLQVLVVADGHGDVKYTHSDLGAQFAAHAVREIVIREANAFREALSPHVGASEWERRRRAENFAKRLATAVRARWYEHVGSYLALKDPRFSRATLDHGFDRAMSAFGTTLLVALIWRDVVVSLRIGDGDIIVVSDGPRRLFRSPEKQFSNVTDSLATPVMQEQGGCETIDVELGCPRLVLLCSDGVSDPYVPAEAAAERQEKPSPLAEKWGAFPLQQCETDWSAWIAGLPRTLARLSSEASFDDVAIAVAWWPALTPPRFNTWAPQRPLPSRSGWLPWVQELGVSLADWAAADAGLEELSFAMCIVGEPAPHAAPTSESTEMECKND